MKLARAAEPAAAGRAHAVYDDTGKMIGGYDRITPEAWAKFDAAWPSGRQRSGSASSPRSGSDYSRGT